MGLLEAPIVGQKLELCSQVAQMFLQKCAVRVGIDEDKAAPAPNADFGQCFFIALHTGKVIGAGNLFEAAVEVPGPAVKGATQFVEAFARV